MKTPRQSGADGGQPVQSIIAPGRGFDDAVVETCPRTHKALGTSRNRQARSLSNSSWRHLARTTTTEGWDDL